MNDFSRMPTEESSRAASSSLDSMKPLPSRIEDVKCRISELLDVL